MFSQDKKVAVCTTVSYFARTVELRKSTTCIGQDTYQGPNGQSYVSRS